MEEKQALAPFVAGVVETNKDTLKTFCRRHKRRLGSAYTYIRNAKKKGNFLPTSLSVLKDNEIIMPIKEWRIEASETGLNLVIKIN